MKNIKLWDWVVWNQRFRWKVIEYIMSLKQFLFLKTYYKMLEITIDNCQKCDLETIIDRNNCQYFWINWRDIEIESKRNWQVIFDKYKDSSSQKYRKELTSNITFQPNKIFVRNDLFEKITRSCKTTNLEFWKLIEKLGLCLYELFVMKKNLFQRQKKFLKKKKILQNMMLKISN